MTPEAIQVHVDATTAVDSLKEPYRRQLFETFHRLQQTDEADWPPGEVTRLPLEDWPYLIRLGPYRVLFGWAEGHRLEVRNIVREETLRLWFSEKETNGSAGG